MQTLVLGKNTPGKARRGTPWFFIVLFLVLLGAGGYLMLHDMEGPTIRIRPDTSRFSLRQDITLELEDVKSQVKSVMVTVRKGEQSSVVLQRGFDAGSATQSVTFNLAESGLKDGKFQLEITATDSSLARFGSGNSKTLTLDAEMDNRPPAVRVRSSAPALRRGSITAVAYSLSEEASMTGVRVNDIFFPAFRQENGLYYCFFAFPLHCPRDQFAPEIVATDLAGNEARTRLIVHAGDRVYRNDTMNISDAFLDSKMPSLADQVPEAATNLERYLAMNGRIRGENEVKLREIGQKTADTMLWQGPFARLPRSATKANFGDHRIYRHNGKEIDQQTHMGLDLASVARAPIPAANNGTVVFAGDLGIYGNLVVVDHGLGLQTLYSHMSEISVQEGDSVKKGDTLGKTGTTGLAGGDHLHFGIMVAGVESQPLDWLDGKWIKNTITDRLTASSR